MKKILFLIAAVLISGFTAQAQVKTDKPRSKQPTAFAIVTDAETYKQIHTELMSYRDALEADGLSTYVVSGAWKNPAQVREELKKLYKKQPNLEGVVLVGDIPVAMIRNAQHMTTAFKMDQEKFPMKESSVASDRFYDDLHLEFDFIAQDTARPLNFYYDLSHTSPQQLNPTFYSGRIAYPSDFGGDKYEGLAKFLRKVVDEKQRPGPLASLLTFAGDSYNSDCLTVWLDEQVAIAENFPQTLKNNHSLKQLNFRMDNFMKFSLFDELERPDLDAAFFNEHGLPAKQVINGDIPALTTNIRMDAIRGDIYHQMLREKAKKGGDPQGAKAYFKKSYHLSDAFFDGLENRDSIRRADSADRKNSYIDLHDLSKLRPQPRFVMLNACYNGSFHQSAYMAAGYLFGDGRTVAVQGNTVNVLQDRWTYELVGLLSHGVRIGQWNRHIATLEGHILGDPTYHYTSISDNTLGGDLVTARHNLPKWKALLNSPYADVRSIALRVLNEAGDQGITSQELLATMQESSLVTTRMECLKLLANRRDEYAAKAIERGLYDSYELTRRNAADYAWKSGDPALMPAIADVYLNYPESQRVNYLLQKSLSLFPSEPMLEALEKVIANSPDLAREKLSASVTKQMKAIESRNQSGLHKIMDAGTLPAERIAAIRSVRNNTYHKYVPQYIEFLKDAKRGTKMRVMMAEALGWFSGSRERETIIEACNTLLTEKSIAPELKLELQQTLNRLK